MSAVQAYHEAACVIPANHVLELFTDLTSLCLVQEKVPYLTCWLAFVVMDISYRYALWGKEEIVKSLSTRLVILS